MWHESERETSWVCCSELIFCYSQQRISITRNTPTQTLCNVCCIRYKCCFSIRAFVAKFTVCLILIESKFTWVAKSTSSEVLIMSRSTGITEELVWLVLVEAWQTGLTGLCANVVWCSNWAGICGIKKGIHILSFRKWYLLFCYCICSHVSSASVFMLCQSVFGKFWQMLVSPEDQSIHPCFSPTFIHCILSSHTNWFFSADNSR